MPTHLHSSIDPVHPTMRDEVNLPMREAQGLEALLREISRAMKNEQELKQLVEKGVDEEIMQHADSLDDALLKAGS